MNVIQLDTRALQCCPVNLQRVAIHIMEAHELVHLIQDDAREFFPMRMDVVSREKLHVAHPQNRGIRKQLVMNYRHATSGPCSVWLFLANND